MEAAELIYFLPRFVSEIEGRQDLRRTRVAILDTGVSWTQFAGRTNRVVGKSFVTSSSDDRGAESPWWLSTDHHGSYMAGIVSHLDPTCDLFICKVAETKDRIGIGRVIQVSDFVSMPK